jgi:hypothetical protein
VADTGGGALEPITDDFMRDMLPRTKTYTVVLLKARADGGEADARQIVWEHGRRNFELRAQGLLAIVCPVTDESELCGIGIFNASPADTERIMDDDPAVKAGLFTYEVHPVRSFPGDSLPG